MSYADDTNQQPGQPNPEDPTPGQFDEPDIAEDPGGDTPIEPDIPDEGDNTI